MSNQTPFAVPEEADLLMFFGAEPNEAAPEDGYWSYETMDNTGTSLEFSYNLFERSIQIVARHNGQESVLISHEGMVSLTILGRGENAFLKGVARTADTQGELQLRLYPKISVRWATLVR